MDNRPRYLEPAGPELADALSRNLCREHRREIAAVDGAAVRDAVAHSLAASVEAYQYLPPGAAGPVFAFGVEAAGRITGVAMVWMLASDGVRRRKAGTLRAARWGVSRAFAVTGARVLEQYIPEWYGRGILFAERLGFVRDAAPFIGRDGGPVVRIALDRDAWERRKKKGKE